MRKTRAFFAQRPKKSFWGGPVRGALMGTTLMSRERAVQDIRRLSLGHRSDRWSSGGKGTEYRLPKCGKVFSNHSYFPRRCNAELAPPASPGKKCWHVIRFNELEEFRAFPPLVLRCSSSAPRPDSLPHVWRRHLVVAYSVAASGRRSPPTTSTCPTMLYRAIASPIGRLPTNATSFPQRLRCCVEGIITSRSCVGTSGVPACHSTAKR